MLPPDVTSLHLTMRWILVLCSCLLHPERVSCHLKCHGHAYWSLNVQLFSINLVCMVVALMQDHTRPFWWSATVGEGFSWSRGATTRILLSSDRISVIWNLRVLDVDSTSQAIGGLQAQILLLKDQIGEKRGEAKISSNFVGPKRWSKLKQCRVLHQVETAKREKETLEQKMKDHYFFFVSWFCVVFLCLKKFGHVVGIVWIGGVPCIYVSQDLREENDQKQEELAAARRRWFTWNSCISRADISKPCLLLNPPGISPRSRRNCGKFNRRAEGFLGNEWKLPHLSWG